MRKVTDLGPREVIHCPTEAEAKAICKLMHEAGLRRCNGDNYLDVNNCYRDHEENTCYCPARGQYGCKERHEKCNFTIYPASDFLEEELKEGDIVYVGDTMDEALKGDRERIFLHKTKAGLYVCVYSGDNESYCTGKKFDVLTREYAIKKSDVKKERKLMMTDAEWEKFQKDNNL